MECCKLLDTLDLLGYGGMCVGTENSQLLQNSLLILQQENHFRKCYYWGRINGVQNDYYIAYGYQKYCLNGRVYFYSTNCLDWMLMPKPTKCGKFLAPLAVNKLEGDPSIITNIYDANPPYPPNEDQNRHYDGPIPRELKEEDRLSSLIEFINEDAIVVPRGAWFKTPNGDIIENSGFEGLTLADARYLKSFLHGRPPQQKWNTNLLTRQDYNYAVDFLDSIDTDVPEVFARRPFGNFTQSVLARNDLLSQIEFPSLWFFVRRAWKEELRHTIHGVIRYGYFFEERSRDGGQEKADLMPFYKLYY